MSRRFSPPVTPTLADETAERVRRNHEQRLRELQDEVQRLARQTPGPWEMVESQELTAAATEVTFANLQGNADRDYRIRARLLTAAGAGVIELRPNGVTANLRRQRISGNAAAVTAGATADGAVGRALAVAGVSTFEITVFAKAGQPRAWQSVAGAHDTTTPEQQADVFIGYWSDTSAEVTSLVLVSPTANGFLAGSEVHLYRRAH